VKSQSWILRFFLIPSSIIAILFVVNFIIDPYSMTGYNLLKIPNKFARDDRVEKVAKLKTEAAYDTIILGSSRVYGTNPLMVSRYLGGSSFNAGVGTARVEDHLGIILLLKRLDKLPKNIIIGLDFYSFNEELSANSYFIKNQDLNFISNMPSNTNYIANFLSVDALRASIKTLENFLGNDKSEPRFDEHGAAHHASKDFSYHIRPGSEKSVYTEADIVKALRFIKTLEYKKMNMKRFEYLKEIILTCKENDSNLYFFLTPLQGELLSKIEADKHLMKMLKSWKTEIGKITPYYDFLLHNEIIDNPEYFNNLTHMNVVTGNLIYARIFDDHNLSLPENFGVLKGVKKRF